jgi:hypothetical protein
MLTTHIIRLPNGDDEQTLTVAGPVDDVNRLMNAARLAVSQELDIIQIERNGGQTKPKPCEGCGE